ncbi:regulatory protein RecX [Candidatus Peregrinibacteria bacterium]|nr:regulatory protein RecX [Candidatus Peregrinibacteria bacterium]
MKSIHDQIWESALRIIEVRINSTFEMRQKLLKKFPDEEGEIIRVIDEMERVQLLSDRRFAEEFVHHLIQKPIGRMKIMIETRRKGLDEDLVDQILENENWSEKESLKKALEEKQRTLNEKDERKRKMKLINFLRNRGFKDSVIYGCLKE